MQSKVEIILSISFFPLMTECLLLGHFLPRGNGIQQFWMLQISYSTVIPEQPTPSWKCGHTLISLPEVRFWFRSAKEALLKEVNITELKQWRRHTELLRLEPWALGTEDSTLWLSDDPWWDNSDPVDLQINSGRIAWDSAIHPGRISYSAYVSPWLAALRHGRDEEHWNKFWVAPSNS